MRVSSTTPSKVVGHSVDLELQTQVAIRTANRRSEIPEWQPLFYPDDFASENRIDSLAQWELTADTLKQYAKAATQIRAGIRGEALKIARALNSSREVSANELSPLELRVSQGFYFESESQSQS